LDATLSLDSLKQLDVLLGMRLLDVALGHLLHHEVGVDLDLLGELAVDDAPLAGDGQGADGGFGVDEAVDAVGDVGERQGVGRLWKGVGC
jgi:hypothetical protein